MASVEHESVKLSIPFESLVDSIAELSLKDKLRLWELLDAQLAQAEEEMWEQDPAVQAEIREARAAYQAGDHMTIDEYKESDNMIITYTAKYTKINSGYMGQLIEWPEVITEGRNLKECKEMLEDALREMIMAYRQQSKEIPLGRALLEQIPVEI